MQDAYNLDAEYSIGLLDVPHKISIAPIVELPFGEGKRWLQSGVGAAILGDWTISSIIGIESGFPMQVRNNTNNTNIFTRMQYANPGTGDAETDGTRHERIAPPAGSGCVRRGLRHRHLVERGGVCATSAVYTLGTLPRTLDRRAHAASQQLGLRRPPRRFASAAAGAARSRSRCSTSPTR